jgi:hypothetical protein
MINAKIILIPLIFNYQKGKYDCIVSQDTNKPIEINIEPNIKISDLLNHTVLQYIQSDIEIFNNRLTDVIIEENELHIYYLTFIMHECSVKSVSQLVHIKDINFPINAQKIIQYL